MLPKFVVNCINIEIRSDIALYYMNTLLKERKHVVTDAVEFENVKGVIVNINPIAGYPFLSLNRILTKTLRKKILEHNDVAIVIPSLFVNDTLELPSYIVQRKWETYGPKSVEELKELTFYEH